MEKMQESINKDLEELKNEHTNKKLLKLKKLQKESTAEYLKQDESVSWKIKWWK